MATEEEDHAEELRRYVEAFDYTTVECRKKIHRIVMNHPSVTKFSLPNDDVDEFSDLAWKLVGKFIARNTNLDTLDLSDLRKLTDHTMSMLCTTLTGSTSLEELNISHNVFGLGGFQNMAQLLSNSPNLTHLDLTGNNVMDSDCFRVVVEALDGGPITHLCCECCNIHDLSVLSTCTLPQLEVLLMENNGVASLPYLGNLSNLKRLDLCNNRIQTIEISSLEELTNLEELIMDQNNIGNEGCKEVAKLLQHERSSLRRLILCGNKIGGEGGEILANSLQGNSTLAELYLGGHGMDITEGWGWRAFLKLVNDITSVKSTYRSNNTLRELHFPSFSGSSQCTKLNKYIQSALRINREHQGNLNAAGRAKVLSTQLNSVTRRELCDLQSASYSYGSIFADIDPILLPTVFFLTCKEHGQSELYCMLIATVPDVASLIDRKAMLGA